LRSEPAELASAPTSMTIEERTRSKKALPDGSLYVGMHGGYVRGRQQAWFELAAMVVVSPEVV
jgi:hypothetical protein